MHFDLLSLFPSSLSVSFLALLAGVVWAFPVDPGAFFVLRAADKIAGNKAAASLLKAAKLESPMTGRKHARNFFRGSRFAAAAAPTGAAAHPAAAPFQRFRGPPRRPYVARAAAQGAPAAPAPTQRRHFAPKR
ncbi:hypothetical protein PAPYR_9975 [Paratrimastix pyriformis]|uniref:Uncharacterized protein n=1 Tax=Paratrimastix pyriformis TaxID=342808 RepID=A0ABQ8U6Z4_9EUKA|nr:hypothetical protein PAPYR_9975 [Paratrimastix pyriformis]